MFGWLFSSVPQRKIQVTFSDDSTAIFWRNYGEGDDHELMAQELRSQGRSWKSIKVWY